MGKDGKSRVQEKEIKFLFGLKSSSQYPLTPDLKVGGSDTFEYKALSIISKVDILTPAFKLGQNNTKS